MDIITLLICTILGYLIGSISISRLVTRIAAPDTDLEQVELPDRNTGGTFRVKTVGATTASMILGPKIGGLIGILDIVKGALPTLIIRLLFPEQPYFLFTGAAIVTGHIWPIYFNFRGGGGLSPALGTFLVLDPLGILISVLLAFLIGIFVLREISFAVMGGPIIFIVWISITSNNWIFIILTLLINLILFVAVWPDIRIHIKAQREGKTDLSTSMDAIPMGQMMKKMMNKMGVSPDKKDQQ